MLPLSGKIGPAPGSGRGDFEEGSIEKFGKLRQSRWKEAVEQPDMFMALGNGTSKSHYNIQCSEIFTLRNEKFHTEI